MTFNLRSVKWYVLESLQIINYKILCTLIAVTHEKIAFSNFLIICPNGKPPYKLFLNHRGNKTASSLPLCTFQ